MKKIVAIVGVAFVAAAAYAAGVCGCDTQKKSTEVTRVEAAQPEGIRPCPCDCSKECKCPEGCNCNVCRKCVEAATGRKAVMAEPQQKSACRCKCECSCDDCDCCRCGCRCCSREQFKVTEYQEQIVSTNNVSVKEFRVGNRFFGASMTVSREGKPPMPSRDVLIDLPPPPPVCRVWVEGYWGWGQAPSGYYLKRWVPGHYESVTVIQ